MATFQDIITEARFIFQETSPDNTHCSDPVLLGYGNECILALYSLIGTYPKTKSAGIVTADSITLPANVLKLDYASFTLADGRKVPLALGDFTDFVRKNPNWENMTDGTPTQLIRTEDKVWTMFPPPDTAHTGLAMTILGTILPTPATLASETPPISQVLHVCIPHYLAYKAFMVLNNSERAQQEYTIYDSLRKMNIRAATQTRGALQGFHW